MVTSCGRTLARAGPGRSRPRRRRASERRTPRERLLTAALPAVGQAPVSPAGGQLGLARDLGGRRLGHLAGLGHPLERELHCWAGRPPHRPSRSGRPSARRTESSLTGVLDFALDRTAQRTRPEHRIVARSDSRSWRRAAAPDPCRGTCARSWASTPATTTGTARTSAASNDHPTTRTKPARRWTGRSSGARCAAARGWTLIEDAGRPRVSQLFIDALTAAERPYQTPAHLSARASVRSGG